jgi:hypothetical protein
MESMSEVDVVWMRKKVGRSGRGDYLYSAALASDPELARFGKMVRAVLRFSLKIAVQNAQSTDQSEGEKDVEVSCRNIKPENFERCLNSSAIIKRL